MKKSLRIVFFGNEKIATGVATEPLVFSALIEAGYDIVCLVIHASETTSRKTREDPIIEVARNAGIPVINPVSLIDSVAYLKSLEADCGVLVAYGKIIPKEVIDIFPMGIINIHPSLLPELRGSTPIESAILSGQSETGVSIMKLVSKMDAGPVLAQRVVAIPPKISKQDLSNTLHIAGKDMILKVLASLSAGEVVEIEQQHDSATFCTLISKNDGLIDWSLDADIILRQARAYYGWPGMRAILGKDSYKVIAMDISTDASISKNKPGNVVVNQGRLFVQCGKDTFLEIISIQPDNKKEMPVKAFLNGYRSRILN